MDLAGRNVRISKAHQRGRVRRVQRGRLLQQGNRLRGAASVQIKLPQRKVAQRGVGEVLHELLKLRFAAVGHADMLHITGGEMGEKRQHRRLRKRLTVKFGDKALQFTGYTIDVSKGGMFLVTGQLFPVHSQVHIQLFLDTTEFRLLEGEVRRQRHVPAQLRSVERGGFGVRFLSAAEVVIDLLNLERVPRFVLSYASPEDLQRAFDRELKHCGVFIVTAQVLLRDSRLVVELELPFAQEALELEATVVHVTPGGGEHPAGLGVIFDDTNTPVALKEFLPVQK